jgi:hypothetical protein
MKTLRGLRCAPGGRCAGVVLAAGALGGLAGPAAGVDRVWNTASGSWSHSGNWWPIGVPTPADRAFIGSSAAAENDTVTLNQAGSVLGLVVTDGMTLRTDDHVLTVNGDVAIAGSNSVVGPGGVVIGYASRVLVEPVKGTSLVAQDISLTDGARLDYVGQGFARFSGTMTVDGASRVTGRGYVDFMGGGTTLNNNGTLVGGTWPGVYVRQLGGGLLDLDGTTGNGVLDLAATPGGTVRVHGSALSDAFDGAVLMSSGSDLDVAMSEGWSAGAACVVTVNGSGGVFEPAQIRGGELDFGGELVVAGESTVVNVVPSELTLGSGARVDVGASAEVNFGAEAGTATTVQGGTYTVGSLGSLRFEGATTMRGGSFQTPTSSYLDGTLDFSGVTTWNGSVTIEGVARHLGDGVVSGPTVVNADRFVLGVLTGVTWSVNSSIVVNAGSLSHVPGNVVLATLNVSGGFVGRLTINLADPDASWRMSGAMNLTGDASLFLTRVAGSAMEVHGDLSVTGGRASVSAPTTFFDHATLTVGPASAILRFTDVTRVAAGTTIAGAGTLQNGSAGDMTLASGVSTAGVGLVNQGTLQIGEGAGIAAVDRFQNTGVWKVEIGGYAAGAEYDRLIVSAGEAAIGGTLDVEVIDGFRPVAGDSFTILTAVGGVSGAFPATAVSEVDGWTYEWEVLANANDVRVRLDVVTPPPCSADFNGDGVVNSQDFFDFLGRFFASDALADFNADGVVNSQDFFDFLTAFFKGCE